MNRLQTALTAINEELQEKENKKAQLEADIDKLKDAKIPLEALMPTEAPAPEIKQVTKTQTPSNDIPF